MIEMRVEGIEIDNKTMLPVVILADDNERRYLAIRMGFYEAEAICLELTGMGLSQPKVYDLLETLIVESGMKLEKVVFDDVREGILRAKISMENRGLNFEIDSRASEAITLALRFGKPIYVSEKVVLKATVSNIEKEMEDIEELQEFIKMVKPSDFAEKRG